MSFFGKLFGSRSEQDAQAREDIVARIEREVSAEQAPSAESSTDDRFELIASGFEDDQYVEYVAHGQSVKDALVLLDEGEVKQARALLEAAIPTADAPRYLLFDLGKARLADDDLPAGIEALESFLSKLHPEEGGDARLHAHFELAAAYSSRGEFDAAVAQYEAALEAQPDDPRPYLAMAGSFRNQELWDEAVEVLDAGLQVIGESGPRWRFWHELGLAHAGAGRDELARELLSRALDHLLSHQHRDLPPEAAVRLAQLHEQAGAPAQALDLYVILSEGSDEARAFAYHVEAARLLSVLGQNNDARHMLERALELAPPDESVRAAITEKLVLLPS
jgi:tetratricopeptide (TPR) repeat protein